MSQTMNRQQRRKKKTTMQNLPPFSQNLGPDSTNMNGSSVSLDQSSPLLEQNIAATPVLKENQNSGQSHRTGTSKSSRNKFDKLERQLTGLIASASMLLVVIPQVSADGIILMQHSESLAQRLIECAKDNESFYKILSMLVTGSAWGALAVECLAITQAMLVAHGVLPQPQYPHLEGDEDSVNTHVPGVPTHP